MTPDSLNQFSDSLADNLAEAATFTVAIRTGRRDRSGILWRDDVVVTSGIPSSALSLFGLATRASLVPWPMRSPTSTDICWSTPSTPARTFS